MTTLLVIIVVVWTVVRIAQFASYLWRLVNATGSARAGVAAAA